MNSSKTMVNDNSYEDNWFNNVKSEEDKSPPEGKPQEEIPESPKIHKYHYDSIENIPIITIDYNKRALSKEATSYELEKFEKNYLLIFSHKDVFGCETREGTEKDVEELKRTFGNCGFEVEVEHDLKKRCIMNKLTQLSYRDFTNYGCVAVAVLTHGRDDGMIMARDMLYNELEIVDHLHARNNPTLLTKPRIVIIQACRGDRSLKGIRTFHAPRIQTDDRLVYTLPDESDLLLLHSSYFGKKSHRHPEFGSWFIQSLCSKINQLSSTLDLEPILTEVKKEVAVDRWDGIWNTKTMEFEVNKQMPVSTSTLTRKLYLRKFGDTVATSTSDFIGPAQTSNVVTQPVVDNPRPETPPPPTLHLSRLSPIPISAAPLPVSAAPQPISETPQPVAAAPLPVSVAPIPVLIQEPLSKAPLPVSAAPQPISETPQPVSAASLPVSAAPLQGSKEPQLSPATFPTLLRPQLVSVAPLPVSAAPLLKSAAPQPLSAASQPVSKAPLPVSTAALPGSLVLLPVSPEPLPALPVSGVPDPLPISPSPSPLPLLPPPSLSPPPQLFNEERQEALENPGQASSNIRGGQLNPATLILTLRETSKTIDFLIYL